MIRNKTLQFKQRYSNSASNIFTNHVRSQTPDLIKNKLFMTGFTHASQATTFNSLRNSKRMAKVETTALIRSRKLLQKKQQKAQLKPFKLQENQTSLCRYLDVKKQKIQNSLSKNQNFSQTAQQSIESEQRKIKLKIKEVENVQQFFMSLSLRSVFFCCKCFQYVFAIQKNLHHPKCQNEMNIKQVPVNKRQQIGWKRLDLILQLSEYTKHKYQTIKSLFQQAQRNQIKEQYKIQISQNSKYLRFQQIVEAFIFTYQKLIKRPFNNKSNIFSMKKIFSCIQPQRYVDSKNQKKMFM